MKGRILAGALALAVLAGGAAPVAAQLQRQPLEVAEGEPYRHAHSGIIVPATLAGQPRASAQASGADNRPWHVDALSAARRPAHPVADAEHTRGRRTADCRDRHLREHANHHDGSGLERVTR
jgi:hypothetical protein